MTEKKRKARKEKQKEERKAQAKLASIKESDILHTDAIGGSEKLTLGDLFQSLDAQKMEGKEFSAIEQTKDKKKPTGEQGTVNTNKLRKQLKSLKKETEKAPALSAPVSGRKRKKQEMQANYEINKQKLGKWIGQVKRAREEVQTDFTTADKVLDGGGVALNSMVQIAANADNVSGFTSQLEQQVQAELKRQGLNSEKDMKTKEMDALGNVDASQLKERFQELSKLKSLLFKSEIKNRRVSKIKSKLYHKIKKRDKEREEKKLVDYMEQVDPEAARAYADK